MNTIHAVYENGVFKPTEPVDLPEHCKVRVEPELKDSEDERRSQIQAEIYEILGERYESDDPFGSERHDEHQP